MTHALLCRPHDLLAQPVWAVGTLTSAVAGAAAREPAWVKVP